MKRFTFAILFSTAILFLWSGIATMLPWGISTPQNISVQSNPTDKDKAVPNFVHLPENTLTTENFELQFNNKISTYKTDHTFSWIITQPLKTDYTGYFTRELFTQFIIAILLSLFLMITMDLNLRTRLSIILLLGMCAAAGTYGQLMNWWKLPLNYGLGVSFNLVFGWLLSSFVVAKFVYKSEN